MQKPYVCSYGWYFIGYCILKYTLLNIYALIAAEDKTDDNNIGQNISVCCDSIVL